MTVSSTTDDDRELVAGLCRAAAYPHPVTEPIRVAETHISWVFLTGQYAYKVKKPVCLSFLDYSTLERRRELCEEELRLNRRLAPGLYVAVSRIAGERRAPRVDGAGDALEYAVRMRQFPRDAELVSLLPTGTLTTTDLAALGATIARFHAAAAAAPAGSAFGEPATVRRVTLDNFAELRSLPEAGAWRERLAALEDRVTALHRELRELMTGRRAGDRVRECHGDLHCGNVVRWNDALTPFDGIEFDPALRFIDVVNDVAFLTMDLAERGQPALRHAVLQAWAETLGDFAGLPLLPYYETYRALVRAKVAALRALQFEAADPLRGAAVAQCLRYLDWAEARLAPARPTLAMTCGLSGSGKTWLASQAAERLGALHLRSDVERKRIAGLGPLDDSRSLPDAGIYTLEFNDRTYERLHDCAAAALAGGESVIVDAAFLRRGERGRFLELARARGLPCAILHCQAPDAVLRERVAARAAARSDASEAGLDVLERQPGYWEPLDERELAMTVAIDTSVSSAVASALGRLEGLGRR